MKSDTVRLKVCFLAAASLIAGSVCAEVLIAEENAFVKQSSPDAIQSTLSQVEINNGSPDSRKIYLRFDVSGLPRNVASACLIMDYKAGTLDDDIRVNLLNDGVNEAWSNSSLTWNNAPGNDVNSGAGFDGSLTTLMTTTAPAGSLSDGDDVVIFSGAPLVSLINDERNGVGGRDGLITFALARNGGPNAALHSLEGAIARGAEQPRIEYALSESASLGVVSDAFSRDNTDQTNSTSFIGASWRQEDGSPNEWLISDHVLHSRSVSLPALIYNDALQTISGNGTNFSLRADVSPKVASAWVGVAFNYQDDGNFYYLRIKEGTSNYQVIAAVNGNQTASLLVNKSDASITFLEDEFYTLAVNSSSEHEYTFSITEVGSSVQVNPTDRFVDDEGHFSGGYAGLHTSVVAGHYGKFDNFSLEVYPDLSSVGLTFSLLGNEAATMGDEDVEAVLAGTDSRTAELFDEIVGEAFVAGEVRSGPLSRAWTCSKASYALGLFHENTDLEAANTHIAEICEYYNDTPDDTSWQSDSMAWAGSIFTRIILMYGQGSEYFPGRLDSSTEELLLGLMWEWANYFSKVSLASRDQSLEWYINESENHDAQRYMPCWGFARIFKDHDVYSGMTYADGQLPEQHYTAWTGYFKQYLAERAKRGLFVEKATNAYSVHTLKGIFDLYEFADDPILKQRAGMLLDLWFAAWAEEQIDGVRGGGKTRVYQGDSSQFSSPDLAGQLGWYFLGIGERLGIDWNDINVGYTAFLCAMTSSYRPSPVVVSIAYDPEVTTCEIRQRCMGLAKSGYYSPPDYILPTETGGIYRYSYKTSEFILGTLMFQALPYSNWVNISSQNRWHGVIFKGHPYARIYPQCESTDNVTYNQQWSAQSKGTLIAQRLIGTMEKTGDMRIWFSGDGVSNRVEIGEWVFVESEGAYAAVRPAYGGYAWVQEGGADRWMKPFDTWSPVIIEVVDKSRFQSYRLFRNKILELPVELIGNRMEYTSVYGDDFVFYMDYSAIPKINGTSIDYAPAEVYNSPFIEGDWGDGVVILKNRDRSVMLDFND